MVNDVMDKGKFGKSDLYESFSILSSWLNGSGFIIFGVIERELWIFKDSVDTMKLSWNDADYNPNLLRCCNKTIAYFSIVIMRYKVTIVYD